jgi:hypothetical protein
VIQLVITTEVPGEQADGDTDAAQDGDGGADDEAAGDNT